MTVSADLPPAVVGTPNAAVVVAVVMVLGPVVVALAVGVVVAGVPVTAVGVVGAAAVMCEILGPPRK